MRRRSLLTVICSTVLAVTGWTDAQAFSPKAIAPSAVSVLPQSDSGGQISVDQSDYLLFSRPASWSKADFYRATLELKGPSGTVALSSQYSEAEQAFYIKPKSELAPGEHYELSARLGGQTQQLNLHVNGRKGGSGPSGQLTADLGRWIPDLSRQRDDWSTNLPDHSLQQTELLQAPKGVTALSGQVRFIRDVPFEGARLSIGNQEVKTDSKGRFLLTNVTSGSQTLTLEAEGYGTYQAHVDLKAGETTRLPYTMWVSRLASEHKIHIDSPTTTEIVVKNPEMPGFELRIPKGTIVKDRFGHVVNDLTITPLPIDRSPFPLPKFNVPTYFTIQPGGSTLVAADGKTPRGAQLIYPNFQHLRPGEEGQFWNYDPRDKGWYSYGRGQVSKDGQQIVPNEGVLIYELTGAMFLNPTPAPPGLPLGPPPPGSPPPPPPPPDPPTDPNDPPVDPPPPPPPPVQGDANNGSPQSNRNSSCTTSANGSAEVADPIDCSSGNFVWNQTDLSLKDLIPVTLGRSYIQDDDTPRAFGKGWASSLDIYISSLTTRCCSGYGEADLVLPTGQRIHYIRSSAGTGYSDAELVHVGSQSPYYRTKIKEVGSSWVLTLRDGSTMSMPWGSSVTSISDRNGNTLNITRNGQLPTRIQGPTGRYIAITLDSSNRISKATDDQGRSVSYSYDSDGYLTTVTYPDATTDQYSYVSFSDYPYKILASHRDRRGVLRMTTQFARYVGRYYTQFQCASTASALSVSTNRMTAMVVAAGNPCDLVRVPTSTGPTSGATSAATTNTSSAGPTDIQVYDCVMYKPAKQIYPDGGYYSFRWTFDNYCRVMNVLITDPKGIKTLREFNIDGHLIKETIALGTAQQRVKTVERTAEYPRFSARGGMPPADAIPSDPTNDPGSNFERSVTDSTGHTTIFKYDTNGNIVEATGPRGTVRATYNTRNQPLTVTNELGQTTTFAYDSNGNMTSVTDTLGRTSSLAYNTVGQVIKATDPLNRVTSFEYNGANLISITDPLNRTQQYAYDAVGRLIKVTNALGRSTTYEYDINDQAVKVTDPAGKVTTMQYDNGGNLLSLTDPLNRVFKWAYDWNNRVASETDPLNQTETYTYDLNGNPVTSVDRKGQSSSASYDGLDRLVSTSDPVGTVFYDYDSQDRVTSLRENGRTISYAYDNLDQLTSETTPEGKVAYTYDTLGKRTGMTVNGTNGITYAYDNGSRLTSMTRGNQTVIFTYDNADHVTGISLPNGLAQLYTYDNADQLTEIRYMKGSTQLGNLTYTYDNAGQRTSMGGSFARTILPSAAPSASYDSNNRLTNWKGQNLTYDANGNLTSDGTYTYTWNARDQLTQVKQGATVVGQYAYDTLGRRYSRTLNGSTTNYLYDGISAVQEKAGATTTDLFGVGVDNYFSKTTSGTTQTYLKDALGSTLGLADSSGALNTTYTYGPYGQTMQTGTADSNSNQYTGREKDAGNLYYYRARYYNTDLSRFISQDPIGLSGGINWYAYVEGDPIQMVDPLGLYSGWDFLQDWNNFNFGAFDVLTFGQTSRLLGQGTVQTCSGMYAGGEVFGTVYGLAWGGAGGAKAALGAAKAAAEPLGLSGLRYSGSAAMKSGIMKDGEHYFSKIIDNYGKYGSKFTIPTKIKGGGPGPDATLYQVEGALNGKPGIFEWIVDHSGAITHRRFVTGGSISGKPNF